MEITFLGTGAAWGLPEMACQCRVCRTMRQKGEERTRTCLLLKGEESLLIDCGPDIRTQLHGRLHRPPDAILITHAHGDHFLGLDDLVAYRRIQDREAWKPIPTYATAETWYRVEQVFGYLLGNLLEKRIAEAGCPLESLRTRVTPFATDHGPMARGSVGYVVEERWGAEPFRLLYTSDCQALPLEPPLDGPLHTLIIQSHWLHEPVENRPHHMSFQRGLEIIERWNPEEVFLVHISEEYALDGDPFPKGLKAIPPGDPMKDPLTGNPYPQPLCHDDWQEVVTRICQDRGIRQRPVVARDGLTMRFPTDR